MWEDDHVTSRSSVSDWSEWFILWCLFMFLPESLPKMSMNSWKCSEQSKSSHVTVRQFLSAVNTERFLLCSLSVEPSTGPGTVRLKKCTCKTKKHRCTVAVCSSVDFEILKQIIETPTFVGAQNFFSQLSVQFLNETFSISTWFKWFLLVC